MVLPPTHIPAWHASFSVQYIPSSHAAPSFAGAGAHIPFTQLPTVHGPLRPAQSSLWTQFVGTPLLVELIPVLDAVVVDPPVAPAPTVSAPPVPVVLEAGCVSIPDAHAMANVGRAESKKRWDAFMVNLVGNKKWRCRWRSWRQSSPRARTRR